MNQEEQTRAAADDYTTSFTVRADADRVYAVINDVRSWWFGDITGSSEGVGDAFTYRYQDVHRSTQKVIELVPGRRVVWEVTDADLTHSSDPGDWKGTRVAFDITTRDGLTKVLFTHEGLRPALPCYDNCAMGWDHYVGGVLPKVIEAG